MTSGPTWKQLGSDLNHCVKLLLGCQNPGSQCFFERNPINFPYPIVWQDTTYCITFTGDFQGFLFCSLREYGFNVALLKETNGQSALNRAKFLGGGEGFVRGA